MRRRILAVLLTVVTSTVTLVVTDAPAVAYPSTTFSYQSELSLGRTSGSLTWYNRSVGVQGSVTDVGYAGNTFVAFTFYIGAFQWYSYETRTATAPNGRPEVTVPFNWTESGPPGGITRVDIKLCHTGYDCVLFRQATRP